MIIPPRPPFPDALRFATSQTVQPTDPPDRLEPQERARLRAASGQASRTYPGLVGELLSKELLAFEELGVRTSKTGLTARLVAELMRAVDK